MKKILVTAMSLLFINTASAEGEPIKVKGEFPLGGFPGCAVQPPKDGCDARITCTGVGTLYGNTGMDLQDATEEALMEARNELAKFYSSKQKAQQALTKVKEASSRSTSDGGKAMTTASTRLMQSVSSTSAEAVLSGVQVLGREVDTNQQAVTVKVGVSCKSQAAASKSKSGATKTNPSEATQSNNNQTNIKLSPEEVRTGPGNIKNMKQEVQNAEDF